MASANAWNYSGSTNLIRLLRHRRGHVIVLLLNSSLHPPPAEYTVSVRKQANELAIGEPTHTTHLDRKMSMDNLSFCRTHWRCPGHKQ